MTAAADEWQLLSDAFGKLARHIDKTKTININVTSIRNEAKEVAQLYFRQTRVALQNLELDDDLSVLDRSFESLIQLSGGPNASSSYKKQIKLVRKLLPKVAARIELNGNVANAGSNPNSEDQRVIETLEGLVTPAASSYRQAIIDLADGSRLSFRGTALELREALRETLDHLAPDAAVTSAPGYVLEKHRSGPTMKQKVRFILKARGQSKSASELPEQTTDTIDEMIGTLTRSVYDRSSVATHVALERKTVIQIRRYVVAVLHHILEL